MTKYHPSQKDVLCECGHKFSDHCTCHPKLRIFRHCFECSCLEFKRMRSAGLANKIKNGNSLR